MSLPTVAVYHDAGSGEFSRACLVYALAEHFAGRARVRRVTARELCASDAWHDDTCLLALPGGADRPYAQLLDGAGNASIRRYLQRGGAFLGVCAGAYYACARIAFEAPAPDVITAQRELALFAGTARGSLHELAEPYALDHVRCAAISGVRVPGSSRDLRALYWGGPEFLPDPGARYTPLLTYALDSGERLAAVRVELGAGRAVLTGVHAEIGGSQFPIEVSRYGADSFEYGMQLSAALDAYDAERREVFGLLMAGLGF